jgi:hypothetical protein
MQTPVFVRTQDFLLWLLPQTAKFPKTMRHTLTNRLECAAIDFQGALALANRRRGAERLHALDGADALLDQVRFLTRLCTDLGWFSGRQYEFAAGKLAEIGRLVGGWRKATPGS